MTESFIIYLNRGGNVFVKMFYQSSVAMLVPLAEISPVPSFKFPIFQNSVRLYCIVGRNQLRIVGRNQLISWNQLAGAQPPLHPLTGQYQLTSTSVSKKLHISCEPWLLLAAL